MSKREPYKKMLSIFEIEELILKSSQDSVFSTDKHGEQALAPWLKALRFNQAWQIVEGILGREITEQEFQGYWSRADTVGRKSTASSDTPNTATFGGYRLRGRASLNRDKKQKQRPKKK